MGDRNRHILDGIQRQHVLRAIESLDAGTPHPFGTSVKYDFLYDGNSYAPKAVVGIAAGFASGINATPADFSGGEGVGQANQILRNLGFKIVRKGSRSEDEIASTVPQRVPRNWFFQSNPEKHDVVGRMRDQDEFYWITPQHFRDVHSGDQVWLYESGPDAGIVGVAQVLTEPIITGAEAVADNFDRDREKFEKPQYRVQLRVLKIVDPRLPNVVLREAPVVGNHRILWAGATATVFPIREDQVVVLYQLLGSGEVFAPVSMHDQVEESAFTEGSWKLRLHFIRERNSAVVLMKKEQTVAADGKLECECCGFDFHAAYGDVGHAFAECHHEVPLAAHNAEYAVTPDDLRIVCSNCHRMLHRKTLKTVEQLKLLLHWSFKTGLDDAERELP